MWLNKFKTKVFTFLEEKSKSWKTGNHFFFKTDTDTRTKELS